MDSKTCGHCVHFKIALGEDHGSCSIGVLDGIVFEEDECPAEHWFCSSVESMMDDDR